MDNEHAHLIGRVYDAGLGAASWDSALDDIMLAVGADVSALFVEDRSRLPAAYDAFALRGYPDYVTAAYSAHFAARDIRLPAVRRLQPREAYVDDRNMPFEEIQRSEIYNDFYRPIGLAHAMAVLPVNEGKRFGIFSVHRAINAGNFRPEEVALFEHLSPHVIRALQLQRQLARANGVAASLSAALDHFPIAVLLTDEQGLIVELNRAAEALLRRPDSPLRVAGKRLSAVSSDDTAALNRAVASAQATLRGSLNAPPPVLRLAKTDAKGAVGVMVAPARRAQHLGMAADRLVLVFVSDPSQATPAVPDLLGAQLGLSPAEARVATRLAAGERIDDIADAHGVSRETVRVQVKNVFAKTGTHNQGQLVGLVSRSLAALRGRQP